MQSLFWGIVQLDDALNAGERFYSSNVGIGVSCELGVSSFKIVALISPEVHSMQFNVSKSGCVMILIRRDVESVELPYLMSPNLKV